MEKHSLLYGVKVGDKVHFDFQVRMPVVKDTIEALSLTYEKYGTTEGAVAATYYRIAVVHRLLLHSAIYLKMKSQLICC